MQKSGGGNLSISLIVPPPHSTLSHPTLPYPTGRVATLPCPLALSTPTHTENIKLAHQHNFCQKDNKVVLNEFCWKECAVANLKWRQTISLMKSQLPPFPVPRLLTLHTSPSPSSSFVIIDQSPQQVYYAQFRYQTNKHNEQTNKRWEMFFWSFFFEERYFEGFILWMLNLARYPSTTLSSVLDD